MVFIGLLFAYIYFLYNYLYIEKFESPPPTLMQPTEIDDPGLFSRMNQQYNQLHDIWKQQAGISTTIATKTCDAVDAVTQKQIDTLVAGYAADAGQTSVSATDKPVYIERAKAELRSQPTSTTMFDCVSWRKDATNKILAEAFFDQSCGGPDDLLVRPDSAAAWTKLFKKITDLGDSVDSLPNILHINENETWMQSVLRPSLEKARVANKALQEGFAVDLICISRADIKAADASLTKISVALTGGQSRIKDIESKWTPLHTQTVSMMDELRKLSQDVSK